jgi:hypothetical protein
MQNKISGMKKPDDIKNYLKDHANNWKNIMHKNCILLTQVYENESGDQGKAALEERFKRVDGQFQKVSEKLIT